MTEKLYRGDPYLRSFSAKVQRRTTAGKHPALVLDRTAFYATSGGQPNDSGVLAGVAIVDVFEDEASGDIVHLLAGAPDGVGEGDQVSGEINWERRFDHMQQHSGQHILSQAFEKSLDAPTVSFHLGADLCTIDVRLAGMSPAQAVAVEDMANAVIFANRPVHVHEVTQSDLARFPLRKQPVVSGMIRIVEVEGFDYSPCGGTHVRSAGEIGLIKIRRWDKRSDALRVDFYCGQRALLDYRRKNDVVNALAAGLSVKDTDVRDAVERSLAQAKDNFKLLDDARQRLMELEARSLIADMPVSNGLRLIVRVFDDRTGEEARRLAMALTATPSTVALLGLRSPDRASLVFARSADLAHDMNALLKASAPLVSGRGGGTPSLAQGGGPGLDGLAAALATAQQTLTQ